jgi:sn-glycerol 3-phosphate transport system ATP-binding protein
MTLADRLAVVNSGIIEQIGTPIEIYDRPMSIFVASFIGSPAMNFMNGKLNGDQLSIGDNVFTLKNPPNFTGDITIGLRPEHLYRKNEHPFSIEFTINLLEPLGADTLLHGKFLGCDEEIVARISRTYPANGPMTLPLYFDEAELHLFDPESGKRVG